MVTVDAAQSRILHHASNLLDAIDDPDVWQFIELFQRSQPNAFMHICHRTLSSYLELTYDYFDRGWPLQTRLGATATVSNPLKNLRSPIKRILRKRMRKTSTDILSNCSDCEQTESERPSLNLTPSSNKIVSPLDQITPTMDWLNLLDATKPKSPAPNTLRTTLAAKGFFRQILPSLPRTPRTQMAETMDLENNNKTITCFDLPVRCSPYRNATPLKLLNEMNSPAIRVLTEDTWNAKFVDTSAPLKANNPRMQNLPYGSTGPINLDGLICQCLMDYMFQSPDVCNTEGIFRIPGSSQRIRDLWCQLRDHIQSPYVRIMGPDSDLSTVGSSTTFADITWSLLDQYTPHDVASLLLRTLASCSSSLKHRVTDYASIRMDDYQLDTIDLTDGLVPAQVSELCFLATRLQYTVEHDSAKWVSQLCQARQVLTYRIAIQLLLPAPERKLLNQFLHLLNTISRLSPASRMSAVCLARCTVTGVFGLPHIQSSGLIHTESSSNPLKWRIDTLTNLIQWADQLEQIPNVIYYAVQNRLRAHLNHSPAQAKSKQSQWTEDNLGKQIDQLFTGCSSEEEQKMPKASKCDSVTTTESIKHTSQKPIRKTRSSSVDCTSSSPSHNRTATTPDTVGAFRFWRRQKSGQISGASQPRQQKHIGIYPMVKMGSLGLIGDLKHSKV